MLYAHIFKARTVKGIKSWGLILTRDVRPVGGVTTNHADKSAAKAAAKAAGATPYNY